MWLEGAPTASELRQALVTDTFREKVKKFIKDTIRADIDGKPNAQVRAMPKIDAVSYSQPLDSKKHDAVDTGNLTQC